MKKLTQIINKIWVYSDKRSFISGLPLSKYELSDMFHNMFAHVLAKGQNKYPYFKLLAENIILVSPREHTILDHGSKGQQLLYSKEIRDKFNGRYKVDWGKLDHKKEELLDLYNELFPETKFGSIMKYSEEEVMEIVLPRNELFFNNLK